MPKCLKSWKDSLFSLFHLCFSTEPKTKTGIQHDVLRHEAASSSCKASQWPLSLYLLGGSQSWLQPTPTSPSTSPSRRSVSHGIRVDALGRSRQWFAALACLRDWRTLRTQGEVSVVSTGAATNSLAQCARWIHALHMLADAPNTFVANAVVSACCRSKVPAYAGQIFDVMSQRGPEPDAITLNTLLGLYAGEGLVSKAEGLMASARKLSLEADLLSFNLYLSTMQRSAKWSESLGCLDQIKSRSLGTDAVTVNSVLAACMRRSQWRQCLVVTMDSEIDVVAVSTVGSAMIQRSVWTSAVAILERAVNSMRLHPDADSFAVLGSSCTKNDIVTEGSHFAPWSVASRLLAACTLERANGVLVGSSLTACSRSRQWQLSMELLGDVQRTAVEVDQMVAYNSITTTWDQSLLIFENLSRQLLKPDLASWTSLVCGWKMSCNYLEALQWQNLKVDQVFLKTHLGAMTLAPWQTSLEAVHAAGGQGVSDPILMSVVVREAARPSWQRSLLFNPNLEKLPNHSMQNAIFTAYQEGYAWPQALNLLKDLVRRTCEPEGLGVSAVFTACGCNWRVMLAAAGFLRSGLDLRVFRSKHRHFLWRTEVDVLGPVKAMEPWPLGSNIWAAWAASLERLDLKM